MVTGHYSKYYETNLLALVVCGLSLQAMEKTAFERMKALEPVTIEEAKGLVLSADPDVASSARDFVAKYPEYQAMWQQSIEFMTEDRKINGDKGCYLTPSMERWMRGEAIWWTWYAKREIEWMEASANDIQWRGYRLQVIDGKKVWSGFTPEGLAGAE